ncbi:MAG: hypothetical protein ACJA13_002057 [Paraglaciecola sp.]|jgi:hypothetical protein
MSAKLKEKKDIARHVKIAIKAPLDLNLPSVEAITATPQLLIDISSI